jgi:8-oxo-dGTP pyrophosphatase MutT (NUDIX family)
MTARHLTASAAVIDPTTRTVLLVWHNASGMWMLPGGHVDPGESPAEAATREVLEETGVTAVLHGHPVDLPGMVWQPSPIVTAVIPAPAKPARPGKPAEDAHWHIDLLYAGTADSTLPTTALLSEVARVCWQPIDRLDDLLVRAEVPQVVALAFQLIGAGTR